MNKLSQTLRFISTLFAIFVVTFIAFALWSWYQKVRLESCVYSIGDNIVEYSKQIGTFAQNSENWYVLTDDEANLVLSEKHIRFEGCSQFGSLPQDIKEKKVEIAVIKNSEHGYRVIVWSKGFDNISGTEDDIFFPFNEKIPN